jgi:endonuclease/exonuclease/phosphatase family metal-dependent hydrolase
VPPAGRTLAGEFAARIASWDWDVALLQEVPPWWPQMLARCAGAEQRTALTSRNAGMVLRRALAERRPDLMKSNGGGANAILSRRGIAAHRALRLRAWPERRVAQLARLSDGMCVANFHGSARVALAEAELERLWEEALEWAVDDPLVLGGDLNLRSPEAPDGTAHVGRRDVDHLFARGLEEVKPAELLDRGVVLAGGPVELSDHLPLAVSLRTVAGAPRQP